MTWGCRGGIFVPASVFALPAKRLKRTSHRSAAKLYRAKSLCPFTCERSDAQFRLSRKKVEDVCSDAAKRSELNERRHRLLNPNTCRGSRRGPRHERLRISHSIRMLLIVRSAEHGPRAFWLPWSAASIICHYRPIDN